MDIKLTKAQKRNLLLIWQGEVTKVHPSGLRSLARNKLIETEYGFYGALTDAGLAAIKIARQEILRKELESWPREALIDAVQLKAQHSFPAGQCFDDELRDWLAEKLT